MALPPRVSRALEVEGAALAAELFACAAARADRPAAAHHAARAALEHACRLLLSAGPVDPVEPHDPHQENVLEELAAELLRRPGLLDPLSARALRAALPLLEPVEPGTPEGAIAPLIDAVERPLTGVIGWMFWSSPAALRLRALPDWPAVGRRLDELRGPVGAPARASPRSAPQVSAPVEDLTDLNLSAPPPRPPPAPALSPAVAQARGEREALQLHRARLAAARVEVEEVLDPPPPPPPARRGGWALALAAALGGALSGAAVSRVALDDAGPAPGPAVAPAAPAGQDMVDNVRVAPDEGAAAAPAPSADAAPSDAPSAPPAPAPPPAAAAAAAGGCPAGMVRVPGGVVTLGQPQGGRGRWPAPEPTEIAPVELPAFCVDSAARTWASLQGQPAARLADGACAKGKAGPERAAVCLSRDEAEAACAAAEARLPSLLEWEQIARVTELSLGPTREWSGERFPPAPLNRRGPTALGDGMFLQALDAPVPAEGNVLWSWNQADPARRLGDLGFRCAASLGGP